MNTSAGPDVRLAVLTTRAGPAERLLFSAMDRRGIPYVQVSERAMARHATTRYRGVLNRIASPTRNAEATSLFEATGHRVFNPGTVVDACGDTATLTQAGIPTTGTPDHTTRVIVIGGVAVANVNKLTSELEWLAQRTAEAVGGGMVAVNVLEAPGGLLVTAVDHFFDISSRAVAELVVEHVDRNSPPLERVREQAA